ncbi:MAG: sugar kinase [Alphaproteobacteria bacterium]|nr:sugar kinase [Alphaproteobacteria bacterium]
MRVLCYGEILLRLAAPGRELLLQTPRLDVTVAGAEANVAVALSSFGHDARMLSVVPDTALGRAAIGELRRHGVDTRGMKFGPGRMGLYFLTHGAVRRPSEIIYDRADSAFARSPEACALNEHLSEADWFHISGVTPALGPASAAAAIAAVRAAQDKGVPVSFDGNFRTKLWESWRSDAPAILRQMFEHADILFGDDRDIALVLNKNFGNGSAEQRRERAAAAAFEAFPRLKRIAATIRVQHSVDNHELGAVMYTRSQVQTVAAVELSSIVDRVGTGDAFAAGVLHGLLTDEVDREALKFGLAATCLKHSIQGDFLTLSVADVRAAMANEGLDVRR